MKLRPTQLFALLLALSGVLCVASILIGTESIQLRAVLDALRAGASVNESPILSIVFQQRLPLERLAVVVVQDGLCRRPVFSRRTEASLFRPSTSTSPAARAAFK